MSESDTSVGQLSPDGHWRWDGSQWQPAGQDAQQQQPQSQASAGDQSGSTAVGQLSPDGNWQWTHKAVVESLCSQGMTYLLADPAVAVVSEGAEFLQALAATGLTLEQALGAASSALQSHGSGTATA
jgi:Flp pilus assembly secretin CpaC